MAINQLPLHQTQKGLKKRQFSSQELVKACLGEIKKNEPKINALITICEKQALKQAKKADHQGWSKKRPLNGIPIAVKDLFNTKAIKTTAGAKVLKNYLPEFDATAIARLKRAGAIILAKTNLDAWGHGSSGENSAFGPTKNPHDLTRVAGGSSSGSAAAVASFFCPIALGTDTGGSIRLPASFCGVVGLKPTYGRVSRYGVISMASSLDSIGHLTRDVTDSAIILKIIAGHDPLDSTTPPVPVDNYLTRLKKGIKGVKIGLPRQYFGQGINPQVKTLIIRTIKKLADQGAKVIDLSLPHSQYALPAYYIIQPSEVSSNLARYDGIRFGLGRRYFGNEAKRRIMLGTYTLSSGYYDAYYLQAMKARTLVKKDFDRAFAQVDLIMAPVSPGLPFKLGEKIDNPLQMYLSDILTVPVNLAGLPALSLPIGMIDNLPVGMQIIGPQFSEAKIFQAAFSCEQIKS